MDEAIEQRQDDVAGLAPPRQQANVMSQTAARSTVVRRSRQAEKCMRMVRHMSRRALLAEPTERHFDVSSSASPYEKVSTQGD